MKKVHLPIVVTPYTCNTCGDCILYDTIFIDDFTGKYIAFNPEIMKPHNHNWKNEMK